MSREQIITRMVERPKVLVGMDLHSRKATLTVADWIYGADPIVRRRFLDVSLDALERTYERNVSKDSLTIIEASTNAFAVVKRLKKIGFKAVVYSSILMGHPAPNRENERMYRSKLRDLAYDLGKDALKEMGCDSAAAFVEHHVAPLYAHLPNAELQTAAK